MRTSHHPDQVFVKGPQGCLEHFGLHLALALVCSIPVSHCMEQKRIDKGSETTLMVPVLGQRAPKRQKPGTSATGRCKAPQQWEKHRFPRNAHRMIRTRSPAEELEDSLHRRLAVAQLPCSVSLGLQTSWIWSQAMQT